MDITEKLKQCQAQLQKVVNAANALESMGQPKGDLYETAIRIDERIKVYKEILEGKTTIENDFPESIYKLRESYQLQHRE